MWTNRIGARGIMSEVNSVDPSKKRSIRWKLKWKGKSKHTLNCVVKSGSTISKATYIERVSKQKRGIHNFTSYMLKIIMLNWKYSFTHTERTALYMKYYSILPPAETLWLAKSKFIKFMIHNGMCRPSTPLPLTPHDSHTVYITGRQ